MMFNRVEYFVGVYGLLQLVMKEVDLLDDAGRPLKKKHLKSTEEDGLAIYKWVGENIKHVDQFQLSKLARVTDERVKKLNNDHSNINNFLLAVMMLRNYLDNLGSKNEQILMLPKVNRLIDFVDVTMSTDDFDSDINRSTFRTADNMFRLATGRPMLSDDVRDAAFKRILKTA